MATVTHPGSSTPAPDPTSDFDDFAAAWWRAAWAGSLMLQTCDDCAFVQHPPRAVCRKCGSTALGWSEHEGGGTIGAATRVTTTTYPAFRDRVPFWVAQLALAPSAHLLANVIDAESVEEISCGSPARVVFAEREGALFPFIRLEA